MMRLSRKPCQKQYVVLAAPIGVRGLPECAFSTVSMARIGSVAIQMPSDCVSFGRAKCHSTASRCTERQISYEGLDLRYVFTLAFTYTICPAYIVTGIAARFSTGPVLVPAHIFLNWR
jgi:hypothetical protein